MEDPKVNIKKLASILSARTAARLMHYEKLPNGRQFLRIWIDWLCLGVGLLVLIAYLQVGPSHDGCYPGGDWDFHDRIAGIGQMLKGSGWLGDFAQDVLGLHRILEDRDPYPILGPAFHEIGVDWPRVSHATTHPPTAFLFAAPVIFLSLAWAGRVWALINFALIFVACRCYGVRWQASLGLALCLGALFDR